MTGSEVKALIHGAGLKCWEVADFMGIRDSEFSRRLRKPFEENDIQKVKDAIENLTENKKASR